VRRRRFRADAQEVRTDPVETEELLAGSQRARSSRYDGHPWRAWRERHPTMARGIIEAIALCVLAGVLVHHFTA
jgi:hypothetical protein